MAECVWQLINGPLDALTGNCAADNVHTRWDFGGAWEATILQSAKKDKAYKCNLGYFNEEKRLAVGGDVMYGTDFMRAKPEQKKEASLRFLEQYMKSVMVADTHAMRSQDPLV